MLPEHFELLLQRWKKNLELWPEIFGDILENLDYSLAEKGIANPTESCAVIRIERN